MYGGSTVFESKFIGGLTVTQDPFNDSLVNMKIPGAISGYEVLFSYR
jgi:hypothetical protein